MNKITNAIYIYIYKIKKMQHTYIKYKINAT